MADGIQYKRGDIVRILDDEEKVKNLQDGHGEYNYKMKHYLGKVGQVVNMDSDGDLHVRFGGTWFVYNPMCCVPAPGEIVYERSGGDVNSENKTLNQAGLNNAFMMMMLAGISGSMSELDSIQVLIAAVAKGDINMVRALLNKNPELLNKIHHDMTPLFVASHEGQHSIVLELLDKGANADISDEKGNSPLMASISRKHSDVGKLLIERGANVNIVNNDGRSALHYAAFTDDSNLVELIGKGCDVNLQDSDGDTALHTAIIAESDAAIAVLCGDINLDPGLVNRKGFNILQLATLINRVIAVDKILDRHKSLVNAKTSDGYITLHIAAVNNHTDCAKLLIEKGNADINSKDLDGHTPLLLAALQGKFECVKLFVEKNADLNAVDGKRCSPLHACCIGRSSSGDMNQMLAAMMGLSLSSGNTDDRLKVAKYLIEKGARTDLKNANGNTFLECCSDASMKRSLSEFIRVRQGGSTNSGSTGSENIGSTNSGPTNRGAAETLGDLLGLPCRRCSSKPATITLLPCSHKSLCRDCAHQANKCPVCQQFIFQRVTTNSSEGDVDCCIQ